MKQAPDTLGIRNGLGIEEGLFDVLRGCMLCGWEVREGGGEKGREIDNKR